MAGKQKRVELCRGRGSSRDDEGGSSCDPYSSYFHDVPPSKKATVYVVSEDAKVRDIFEHNKIFFATLGYANEVLIQSDKAGIAEDAVSAVTARATMYMPFAELVDVAKEIERT